MRQHVRQILLILCFSLLATNFSNAEQYMSGDLAPKNSPDSELNVADLLILERLILEAESPTAAELIIADVAPLGNPDGVLNVADKLILQRAIMGELTLPLVTILPPAPILDAVASITTQNPFNLTGTSEPDTTIYIYINGNKQQEVISNSVDGSFSFDAYLYDGINTIHAKAFDGVDFSQNSNTVNVQYNNTTNRTQGGVIAAGTVEVWTPGIPNVAYEVTSSLLIEAGASLVLMPGTKVKITKTSPLTNITVDGELITLGNITDGNIYFTSLEASPAMNDWLGIIVNSGANIELDYAVVEYANAGITFNQANGKITNSKIENCSVGIHINSSSPEVLTTVVTNNTTGINILDDSSPIIFQNEIVNNSKGIVLSGYSSVDLGTNPNPDIQRNTISDNNTNLEAVSFFDSENVTLDVKYNWWGTTDISEISSKIIDYSTRIAYETNTHPIVDFTEFLDEENGLAVQIGDYLNGPLKADTIITAGSTYSIIGSVLIPDGVTLTVQQGAKLQFADSHRIIVKGNLISQGVSGNRTVFTTLNQNKLPGDWYGLIFESTSGGSILNYMKIEYAEYGIWEENVSIDVTNNGIQFNKTNGIYLSNSSPNISNNSIFSNGKNTVDLLSSGSGTGISIHAKSSPAITQNNIINNKTGIYVEGNSTLADNPDPSINYNNIYSDAPPPNTFINDDMSYETGWFANAAQTTLDAKNNWWGTIDVAEIKELIKDNSDSQRSPVVDFSSFLDGIDGSPIAGDYLMGTLTSDTIIAANTEYTVLNNLYVPSGITLTIETGVTLHFVDATLFVDGNLDIQGTINSPVHLRSSNENNPLTNDWGGIWINDGAGTVNINYAIIEHAMTGITFDGSVSSSTVNGSIIRHNQEGIVIDGASPLITANTITSNGNGINIKNISSPIITGNNRIIDNSYGITVSGNYMGTTDVNPVVTNNSIYDNRIYDYQGSSCNSFISKPHSLSAINNWWGTTDPHEIAAKIRDKKTDNRCVNIDFSGFLESEDGVPDVDAHEFLHGTLDGNLTLLANKKYLINGWFTVPAGLSLTIQEGVELKFFGYSSTKLLIDGSLIVEGTALNPVVFTTAKKTPTTSLSQSDWYGIEITDNATVVDIDYAVIEYANRGVYFNFGQGVLQNSILRRNTHAVYINGSQSVQLLNNTIVDNGYGIYLNGTVSDPQPIILNNDIYNNSDSNLHLKDYDLATVLNVTNNWWGTSDTSSIMNYVSSNNGVEASVVDLGSPSTQANGVTILTNVNLTEQYISPAVSPGQKDNVKFTAALNESASWTINILNNENVSVKSTLPVVSSAIDFTWNGKNDSNVQVNDGVYKFYVTVTSNVTSTQYYGSVLVDNLEPAAEITSIVDSQLINELPYLQIIGTAQDHNIDYYQLSYANSFTQNSSDFISIPNSYKKLSKVNSLITSWLLYNESAGFQIQPGNKTIRLLVSDKAGNTTTIYKNINLDYPGIANVYHSADSINSVKGEVSVINFTLGSPGTLTLKIALETDSSKTPLYEKTQIYSAAGDYSLSWDGKTTGNDYLPEEAYSYELELTNAGNTIVYTEPRVPRINTTFQPEIIKWFSIAKNDFFKMQVLHNSRSRFSFCASEILGSTCTSSGAKPYKSVPTLSSRSWYVWDGRSDDGTPLQSHLTYWSGFLGNTQLKPLSIVVKGTKPFISNGGELPDIEIKPSSYNVRHSYEEISTINYQIDQDSIVTITLLPPGIYDPADPLAIIIESGVTKSSESSPNVPMIHGFTWHGYDHAAPIPDTNNILIENEGQYTFTIEATSVETGMSSIYRGNLSLYK